MNKPLRILFMAVTVTTLAVWVLCGSVAPASAQVRFVAEGQVGGNAPLAEGDWNAGVTAGVSLGVGLSTGPLLIVIPVGVSYGEAFNEDVGAFGNVNVTVGPTVLFKLRPVLLGWKFEGLTRISDDPRNPLDPISGEDLGRRPQIGFETGPVLWWPLRKWLALSLEVTWQYSGPVEDLERYYWPEHTVGWSTGLVFTL